MSTISTAQYDALNNELQITFGESKAVYTYTGVKPEIATSLADAESKGKYFNENIRNHYKWTRNK